MMLDTELESSVISAALDGNADALIAPIDYFASPDHVIIWRAIKKLVASGILTPDRVLVANESGYALEALPNAPYTPENIPEYVDRLRTHWMQRRITQEASSLLAQAKDPRLVESATRKMQQVSVDLLGGTPSVQTLGEIYKTWSKTRGTYVGGWPLPSLQRVLRGIDQGQLILIGGPPSSGKTSFVLQVIQYNADKGRPALFFSMDTTKSNLLFRFVAKKSGIPVARVRELEPYLEDPSQTSTELRMIRDTVKKVLTQPVYVNDDRTHVVEDIAAISKSVKAKVGSLSLIVIDFIQLIRLPGKNRVTELDEASQVLRALARELDCATIALSQVTREAARNEKAGPKMYYFRDSGGLEQNADTAMYIERELTAKPSREGWLPATIHILKSKDTPIGKFECWFDPTRLDFKERENA